MTDDLERRLRTERSRREEGYVQLALPARPEAQGRSLAAPLRFGLLAATAVAAGLLVAFVSGAFSPEGTNGVGGSSSPSPSSGVGEGVCPTGSIVLVSEPWGGAAGSRGTEVSLQLRDAAAACDLPQPVSARVVDERGSVLVTGRSDAVSPVRLEAGARYTIGVAWSNWCDIAPATLRWDLRFGDSGSWVDVIALQASNGGPSAASTVLVPPCLGIGGSHLNVTDLQLAP